MELGWCKYNQQRTPYFTEASKRELRILQLFLNDEVSVGQAIHRTNPRSCSCVMHLQELFVSNGKKQGKWVSYDFNVFLCNERQNKKHLSSGSMCISTRDGPELPSLDSDLTYPKGWGEGGVRAQCSGLGPYLMLTQKHSLESPLSEARSILESFATSLQSRSRKVLTL